MSTINFEDFNLEDINKITDMASHIKSLEKKLRRYELVFEYKSEAIEVVDAEGRILYVNKNFSELTGIPREERLGKNIYDVNPDSVLVQVLSQREPIFNAIATTQGSSGHGLLNGYPLFRDGELIGAFIFGKDYSQAVRLSQKLNERELYLKETSKRTSSYFFSDIVSHNPKIRDIIALARQVASTEDPVVLIGEIGTGRDLFAQAIHSASPRNNKPFFKIDCTKYSEKELDYELFGCEENSFPEAVTRKIGLLELVDGGTLFLENLQELPDSLQSNLIQILMDGKGVRLIASLNTPIKDSFYNGFINKDLFKYLKNHCISLPPLRERIDDIPDLVHLFISKSSKIIGKHVNGIRQEALELLKKYDWPGNVSELESVVMMIILTLDRDVITHDHVLSRLPLVFNEHIENRIMPLEEIEKISILNALKVYGDSLSGKKQAAEELQISLGTLYNKMKKYNL